MPKIVPFIWLEKDADKAAELYVSLFPDSRILSTSQWGEGTAGTKGSVMTVTFELSGREYIAFNGGPHFKLNEAFSISVEVDTQEEIDRYWDALLAGGGAEQMCGWLRDRFGLSWQILPHKLKRYFTDKDPARAQRVMDAMFKMQKLDIAALDRAYAG
jgi:predicted 3-demethylubiquinone-9 3-methyltransferase (glyoxalase superfamily)